jgi:hypothetical protein
LRDPQMLSAKFRWYSVNFNLTVEDHALVGLDEAIHIADTYFGRADGKHTWGEAAIAATTFGFGSETEFVEFCINGPRDISYRFEASDMSVPWFLKPWRGTFQHKENLRSRDEMIQRIQEFFSSPADEILNRYKKRS